MLSSITVLASIGDVVLNAAQIAALSAANDDFTTSVTATTGTTLTAAAISSGIIQRTGPTAAFTDTTDTAANIIAAHPGVASFYVYMKNSTAFAQTVAGGTGVTFSASNVIPANCMTLFIVTLTQSPAAVSFTHVMTSQLAQTSPSASVALTTVGAGTITGQGIATQLTTRGGTQTGPFTDTTDIAANIIAAQPDTHVGASWEYTYVNNTIFPATIAAGATGVTVSGATVVPANSWITYLVTYSATATITMQAIAQGYFPTVGTFVLNGVTPVTVAAATVTAGSQIAITLKTVGGTVGAQPHVETITPGTGFTVEGTASDSSTYNYEIRG